MMKRVIGLAIGALAIASGACAQDGAGFAGNGEKGLGDCSRAQIRYYVDVGLSEEEIRGVCLEGDSLHCAFDQCTGEAVDVLVSEGFSYEQIEAMCGEARCEEPGKD